MPLDDQFHPPHQVFALLPLSDSATGLDFPAVAQRLAPRSIHLQVSQGLFQPQEFLLFTLKRFPNLVGTIIDQQSLRALPHH